MNRILDILIPRFITERVALIDANGQLEIACALSNVRPNERFDGIATIRSFNLAGFALFPKMVDGPTHGQCNSTRATRTRRMQSISRPAPGARVLQSCWLLARSHPSERSGK